MRQKRAKTYKKLMALYSLSFGFRQPYQVLVDSHICKDAVDHKIDIVKQLGLVLQGNVKPMITQCCIHELYLQGKTQQPAVDLAKTFERRKCNHREAIPGDECLTSVIGDKNKHRYIVASQSQPLRSKLRQVPGVPLVHINRIVMVLEPASDATIAAKEADEQQSLQPNSSGATPLTNKLEQEPPKTKRKGPKAPNPLSVKKKVKKPSAEIVQSAKGKPNGDIRTGRERSTADPKGITSSEGPGDSVGEKRKRVLDNEGAQSPAESEFPIGRKRKRRRKTGGGTLGDEDS